VTGPDDLAAAALDRYILRALGPLAGRAWAPVEEASAWLGVGRSSAYEAVRRGELPALRIGHRLVVPVPALVALMLGLPEHGEAMSKFMSVAMLERHEQPQRETPRPTFERKEE